MANAADIPPEAAEVLGRFESMLRSSFGEAVGALSLYGSVARGGFDPARSDIDVVIELDDPASRVEALARIHSELAATGRLGKLLQASYVDPRADPDQVVVGFNDGRWRSRDQPLGAVTRRQLGRPVDDEEIIDEMAYNIREYWAAKARKPWLWIANVWTDLAVLTYPRILITLSTGQIVTKQDAADWLAVASPQWLPLIEDARGQRMGRLRRWRMMVSFVSVMQAEGERRLVALGRRRPPAS